MKLLLASFLLTSLASAAQFSVEKTATGGAIVKVDGQVFAEYIVDQANKPYLAPVFGPTGKQMTRNYPMKTIEGEQHDHPHHRGICFGLEGINGIESWAERLTYSDPVKGAAHLSKLGSEKHREFKTLEAKADSAVLVSIIDYLDPSGKKYLEEERTMIFTAGEGTRSIELKQVLLATEGTATFEDKKDAGLSIRVPTEMAVNIEKNKKGSGHIINSDGITDVNAWGKRAKWCDYYGTVGGEKLGVAILNHPSSFRFPTPWHVRDYGLFTANPFGTKALDKNAPDGTYELKKGEHTLLRHLFYFHKGDEKEGKVAEAFEAFSKQ